MPDFPKAAKIFFLKACISRASFCSWLKFIEGRTSVRNKPRPGRPTEAVTPTTLANLDIYVNKDHSTTLKEVANQFSICKVSTQILNEKLSLSKVSASNS